MYRPMIQPVIIQLTFVSGGPQRELFRLLAVEAATVFFTGCQDCKFFDSNVSFIQVDCSAYNSRLTVYN